MEVVSPTRTEMVKGKRITVVERSSKAWSELFANIVRVPFDYKKFGSADIDDGAFPRPFWKSEVSQEEWSEIHSRYGTLIQHGHFMRMRNTIFAMRMAAGWDDVQEDVIWGMLAYYYDSLGVEEPFIEARGGTAINNLSPDAMVSVRMLTLLNAHIMNISFPSVPTPVVVEVARYTFDDPFRADAQLKSTLAVMRQSAFALSRVGEMIQYFKPGDGNPRPILIGYDVRPILANDHQYYRVMHDVIKETTNELKEFGLTALREMCVNLLDAEVNDEHMSQLVFLGAASALAGFSRSKEEVSFQSLNTDDSAPHNPPFEEFLRDEWMALTSTLHKRGKLLNHSTWERIVPSILTTKSSGGYKAEVEIEVPERAGGVRVRGAGGKSIVDARLTSKLGVFLANPNMMVSKNEITRPYTEDDPGTLGQRHVPGGRETRSIMARRLPHFLGEAVFALGANDILQSVDESRAAIGSVNDFQAGVDRNVPLLDHALGAVYSTDDGVICDASDYSSFDFTQKEANTRRIARSAIVDQLKILGITGEWGPFSGGLPELVETLWGLGISNKAVFKIPKSGELVVTDQLQSGEFITFVFNSLSNRANVRLQETRRNAVFGGEITLLFLRIMGDDLMRFLRVTNKSDWTANMLEQVMNIHIDTAGENGFRIQKTKAVMRFFYYEFLKKTFVYGVHVPLLQMQVIAGEKPDNSVALIERFVGYYSTIQTAAMRGLDSRYGMRLLYWTFCIRRGLMRIERDERIVHYVPMCTLWTPKAWGGVGIVPQTLHAGAGLDGAIAVLAYGNPAWRNLIEKAGGILDVKGQSVIMRTARNVARGRGTNPPAFFEPGRKYLQERLIQKRIEASDAAGRKLLSVGVTPPLDLKYTRMPEQQVALMLSSEGNLRSLASLDQNDKVRRITRQRVEGQRKDLAKDFAWIGSMVWSEFAPEPNGVSDSLSPVAGIDKETKSRLIEIGVGASPDAWRFTANDVTLMLRRDQFARRDLTAEQLFAILTSADMISNPERIINVLVYMGFRADLAMKVALRMNEKSGSLVQLRQAAKITSTAGGFTSWASQSIDNYQRLIDADDLMKPEANALVNEIAYSLCIIRSFERGALRGICVRAGSSTLALINKDITGPFKREWMMMGLQGGYRNRRTPTTILK